MISASRADIVSSFTVVKGSMIEETYAVFAAWDFSCSKRENLERLRSDNFIGASSMTWLRDIAKVLNRRFQPEGRDQPLITLAKQGLNIDEWKPLLLWHMTRDEFLVRDFFQTWLFDAYDSGTFRVRSEDVTSYLAGIGKRGAKTEHEWSEETTKRVAGGLLKIAADFGLMRGSAVKEFVSYHLSERSFIYLLHAMNDEYNSPSKVIASLDWRLFLMRPSDVEHELLRLHQYRKLDYQVAGSIVQLSLPCSSLREYAERMIA
jgi:hypothetical protein